MRLLLFLFATLLAPSATAQVRVFIAGDSTAQDNPSARYPEAGWGTMLRCAFGPDVTVENRAIGGRSTRTFIGEGRLDAIARDIGRGDTLLIQFGHNDANVKRPERYIDVPGYKLLLARFIEIARAAGAQPVLLTPVTRRNFKGDRIISSFAAYSTGVREVARVTKTPLIDLDMRSAAWIERAGVDASKRYFLHYPPEAKMPAFPNGIADDTHFSELGARGVADIVAAALAELDLPISARVLPVRPALAVGQPIGNPGCDASAHWPKVFGVVPARLSLPASEGSYRVTVTRSGSPLTIKAETRRMMIRDWRTRARRSETRSFIVDVRNARLAALRANAPGGDRVRLNAREAGSPSWDDALSLEFLGRAPGITELRIERVTAPTLFLFGDSTVTDQRCEPAASWGQMLPLFMRPDVAIANHAESGETLKSFMSGLRLDKALERIKPGDFALIQFAHNDQKAQWPQTYADAATTYRTWLRTYLAELRRRGATPLLVTSPERRNFNADGTIRATLADHAAAMRVVASEETVALIDLNAASIGIYQTLGVQRSPRLFADGGADLTHHSNQGAYSLAHAVAEGIFKSGSPLADWLVPLEGTTPSVTMQLAASEPCSKAMDAKP